MGLKWPQFLHLGKRVALSCLAGLPRGGHWDLVNPTVYGTRVPSFQVEEAGSAWVLVCEETPLADCCIRAHQMALLPSPHHCLPSPQPGAEAEGWELAEP